MAGDATITLELVRVEEADDAGAFRLGVQEYLLRSGDGTYAPATLRWDEALIQQLARARAGDPEAIQGLGAGLRRFVAGSGFAAREPEIARALAERRTVRVEVVSNAAELYALPWELLTLRDGRHVGELPGVEIVYRWPSAQAAASEVPPAREGGRVLVAWSRAFGNVGELLAVDAIEAAMRAARLPFDRGRDVVEEASLPAIVAALAAGQASGEPPTLLYVLCHGAPMGSTYGLGLDDGRGGRTVVDGGTLRRALGPFAGQVRAAIVMACDSGNAGALGSYLGSVAHELHRGGFAAVVAPRAPISGGAALEMTGYVLSGMLEGAWSIERAFAAGRERLVRGGGEWAGFQLYSHAGPAGTRPFTVRPYRGLLAFEREHAALFFGREAELAEASRDLEALVAAGRPRLLVVAGASGTGKSSLVLAPLRVALERRGTFVAVIRPGKEPLAALTAARQGRPPDRPFALIVDQFEEVFTHVVDRGRAAEAGAFARALWDMVSKPGTNEAAIVTLRVDFAGRCGELALDAAGTRLDRIVYDEAFRVFVAQMAPEGLRAAIEGPAARVGLRVEPGLAERLIGEVAGESNALPLLSYVLDELWRRRTGDMLTHAALEAAGGVTGALARHADAVVEALDEPARAQARRTLVHLVMFGSDRSSGARRREEVQHLRSRRDPQAWERAAATLIDARLVVRRGEAEPTLEIAHEALIRHWDRLWTWYEADRDRLAMHNELERLVAQFKQYGALTGKALAFGQELLAGLDADDAPAGAIEAITLSSARARRQLWIRRGLVAGSLVVLATFSIVAAVLYSIAQERAEDAATAAARADAVAARNADAARLSAAQRLLSDKPQVSAALLRGVTASDLFGWRQAAFEVVQEPLPTIWPMTQRVAKVAFAADGALAIRDEQGAIRVWPADGPPHAVAGLPPDVKLVALAGEHLFALGDERLTAWALAGDAVVERASVRIPRGTFERLLVGERTGVVLVKPYWQGEGSPEQTAWRLAGDRFEALHRRPTCIAEDPASERSVCRVDRNAVQVESWTGEVVGRVDERWIGDARPTPGGLVMSDPMSGGDGWPDEIVWHWSGEGLPGRRRVIAGTHFGALMSTIAVFAGHTVFLSPGAVVAAPSRLCTLRATGEELPGCAEVSAGCQLFGIVGEQVVLGCEEEVQLRTAETLAVARHLRGLDARVWEVGVDPRGHVAVQDQDRRVWRWRAGDMPSRLTVIDERWVPYEPAGYTYLPHLQADHGRIASVAWEYETALRVDVRALRSDALPGLSSPVSTRIPLLPGEEWGGHVITGDAIVLASRASDGRSDGGRIFVVRPRDGGPEQRSPRLPAGYDAVLLAATRDGSFAFARGPRALLRLDLRGDAVVAAPVLEGVELRRIAAVDPSGRVLAAETVDDVVDDGTLELLDTTTGEALPRDAALAAVKLRSAAFSADGTKMALGTADGEIVIAALAPGRPLAASHRLRRHRAEMVAVAFSADGRMLAGADALGRLVLWGGGPEGDGAHVTVEVPEAIWNVGISPDGRQLWALSQLGVLRYWAIPGDDAALRRELAERSTYCLTGRELEEVTGMVAGDGGAERCGERTP